MALKYPTDPIPEYVFEEELNFRTLISQFENGAEQRRAKWSQGRRIFSLKYHVKKREEIDRLWNFYQLCKGAHKSFLFKNPLGPALPHEETKVWLPLHEGEGTRVHDWNGFIYPEYSCRFLDDRLSYEEFSIRLQRSSIKLYQESLLTFTNHYGILSGGFFWMDCPDGSACPNFNGTDGQINLGNASDLNPGTGDFSFALGIYANSLSSQVGVLSKKQDALSSSPGYHLIVGTNGQITFRLADGATQDVINSVTGAITAGTWKIITVILNRGGNGQIYVNNQTSGSPVALTAGNIDNTRNFYLGRAEGVNYGNAKIRNFLFAKKVWSAEEREKIWNTWRGIFQI